jgi:hypothetical protein
MPVLECSCGMVMSVSIAKPRNMCIRCGGAEFRELESFDPNVNATSCAPLPPTSKCANYASSFSAPAGIAPNFDSLQIVRFSGT